MSPDSFTLAALCWWWGRLLVLFIYCAVRCVCDLTGLSSGGGWCKGLVCWEHRWSVSSCLTQVIAERLFPPARYLPLRRFAEPNAQARGGSSCRSCYCSDARLSWVPNIPYRQQGIAVGFFPSRVDCLPMSSADRHGCRWMPTSGIGNWWRSSPPGRTAVKPWRGTSN